MQTERQETEARSVRHSGLYFYRSLNMPHARNDVARMRGRKIHVFLGKLFIRDFLDWHAKARTHIVFRPKQFSSHAEQIDIRYQHLGKHDTFLILNMVFDLFGKRAHLGIEHGFVRRDIPQHDDDALG